ncbi:MAG: hypothetical protein HY021_15225 [Burkholderiales bacterium]|nr:hypothetical protein [Burkholderiales bacterium]
MLHPLVQLLAAKPHLMADHLAGYGRLLGLQANEALRAVRGSVLLLAASVCCALVGTGLAGVALLLLGALPVQPMPMAWLLVAVPAAPLIAAALCILAWRQRRGAPSLQALNAQIDADLALLREAGGA